MSWFFPPRACRRSVGCWHTSGSWVVLAASFLPVPGERCFPTMNFWSWNVTIRWNCLTAGVSLLLELRFSWSTCSPIRAMMRFFSYRYRNSTPAFSTSRFHRSHIFLSVRNRIRYIGFKPFQLGRDSSSFCCNRRFALSSSIAALGRWRGD